ncbi:MAG: peptidoglycan binding domain-containing protein, partial [Actinobacteria bacterium]|nr:peptidoglycan binding domain-containing protein [Actinomycetota bacterium]
MGTTPISEDAATKRRFPRPGKRAAIILAVIGGLAVLGIGGVSYATYDYSNDYEGRILPGAEIAGVDVSGMTRRQAISAVRGAMSDQMDELVTITWEDKTWEGTRADLGARLDVKTAVQAALSASSETSFMKKAQMRVFGDEFDFSRAVAIRYPMSGVRAFVAGIASDFAREPRDASVDYSSGWVKFLEAQQGREVRIEKSARALAAALRSGSSASQLSVETIEPEVTEGTYE